ncbi:MAG: hypothetical protein HY901_17740 [Deltaproteobacteria bacterium]|nr:hypothetical protein [Deltaproteobacteria bacterium]
MNVTPETGTHLPFDRFWRWVKDHPNCVLEAGSAGASVFDFEDFHWGFVQEEEGRVLVQAIRGKSLVAELVIDPSEVTYVQASPDAEGADRGQWIFEAMSGKGQEEFVVAYFVLAHGLDDLGKHEVLKH